MVENNKQNLKILLLATDFYPKKSGGGFIDWHVAKHLANKDDDVIVVTPRNNETQVREVIDNIEIRRPFSGPNDNIPPNSSYGQLHRLYFAILTFPYLLRLCSRQGFDIVYSTNYLFHPISFIINLIFDLHYISFVGYSPCINPDITRFDPVLLLENIFMRLFMGDTVICQSPPIYDKLTQLSNTDVCLVNGILNEKKIRSVNKLTNDFGIDEPDTEVRLIFVGRLVDIKNPTILPRILSRISEEYSLVIVGSGPLQSEVEAVINKRGVSERVHLTGTLPHEDTLNLISESDLLLVTSKAESYGTVVLEALSLGTPVLATPVGVVPTVDHPGLTSAKIEDFAKVIPDLELDNSENIDEDILQQFSISRFANDVREKMLDSLS